MTYRFTVHGKPGAWARPRPRKFKGTVSAYHGMLNPNEKVLNTLAQECQIERPSVCPFAGPVSVDCRFVFQFPASWSGKKKRLFDGQHKTSKPDIDNLMKHILDAMTRAAWWEDDAQIAEVVAQKVWGESPRTEVTVTHKGGE